ncbi:unnamed protein product, partial [Coregonus sp. 'balchen']
CNPLPVTRGSFRPPSAPQCPGDVKDIQNSLAEISNDGRQSINTIENLKNIKYAGMEHNQLASTVDNLKNIFSINMHNMKIRNYFGKGQGLPDNLAKQLWIVLQHAMGQAGATVSSDACPAVIESVVSDLFGPKLSQDRLVLLVNW